MKKMIFVAAALISFNAFGEGEDLERCLTWNGVHMDQHACDVLREEKAHDDEVKKRQAEFNEQYRIEREKTAAEEAKRRAESDEQAKQYRAEEARKNRENTLARDRQQREEDAALKHKCGKDYLALRIGMKVDRMEECVGATYETETVTQKGTVETWRTNFDWVNVQNGVVIGYTKRTY